MYLSLFTYLNHVLTACQAEEDELDIQKTQKFHQFCQQCLVLSLSFYQDVFVSDLWWVSPLVYCHWPPVVTRSSWHPHLVSLECLCSPCKMISVVLALEGVVVTVIAETVLMSCVHSHNWHWPGGDMEWWHGSHQHTSDHCVPLCPPSVLHSASREENSAANISCYKQVMSSLLRRTGLSPLHTLAGCLEIKKILIFVLLLSLDYSFR